MGLDMYVTKVAKVVADQYSDTPKLGNIREEDIVDKDFAYWRKFNALHGWMEALFVSKGGIGEFNCRPVRLELQDIDALQRDAEAKALTPVGGFFFGPQDPFSDADRDEVLAFCNKAREALNDGFALYYDSWW